MAFHYLSNALVLVPMLEGILKCLLHSWSISWIFFPFMFRIKGRSLIYPPHLHPHSSLLTDYRWEITAYFRSLPEASANKDVEQWIPTDTRQWEQPPLLTPIKSMSSEPLCVQLYIEHPSLSEPKPQNGGV